MTEPESFVEKAGAPSEHETECLDACELPPPHPLKDTLERLAEIDDSTVLVQMNDRAPQHLYPKLEDRGYEYETFEDECVVTVIWKRR
ncbi:MAG: DUF2249 domain-containing protein [Halobacteria archaeon]|nr:DUF2249 domain-containing protein [Halobacteria archaeon]